MIPTFDDPMENLAWSNRDMLRAGMSHHPLVKLLQAAFEAGRSAREQELDLLLKTVKNVLINADDFLHLTYRIDGDAKRKEIGGGILLKIRELRKELEVL